jgi:hypothetical protein
MNTLALARDLAQFHAESLKRPPCSLELALRTKVSRRLESLVERFTESSGRAETALCHLLEELAELMDDIEGGQL